MTPILRGHAPFAALVLAALIAGCSENLASDPARFDSRLALRNWSDTLVLGERRRVAVRVLDDADREVLDRTVQWTNAAPAVLDIALAPGSSAGAGSSSTAVASTDSVEMHGLGTGTSDVTFHFADALFNATELTKSVTVVAAGVRTLTASDTTLLSIGDTAVLIGSALGRDIDGVTLVPVPHQGVTWTRRGDGAVSLFGEGDTVRVEAEHNGTDTIVVSHPRCLYGAHCADTVFVTVNAPPSAGGDVIVLTDIDIWDDGWGGFKPENQAFAANVVGFAGSAPRMSGHTVMYYSGSSPVCGSWCSSYLDGLTSKVTGMGYTIVNETASLADIPSDVKVVFILIPGTPLGQADVNGLKQFASEGGRVVLMSDNGLLWLSSNHFAAQNQLLSDLGAHMTINSACVASGYAPAEGTHQVVTGVSQLYAACASTITPGLGAYTLFRDVPAGQVIGAVAKIDVTPLP